MIRRKWIFQGGGTDQGQNVVQISSYIFLQRDNSRSPLVSALYFCGAFIQLPFIMSSCFHWDHHELPFTKLKIISVLTRCNGHFGLWKPFPLTFFNVACLPHHWLFCFCPLKMLVHWAQPTDSHPTPGSTPSYHPWPANSYREIPSTSSLGNSNSRHTKLNSSSCKSVPLLDFLSLKDMKAEVTKQNKQIETNKKP